jgi:hypothetical protein
MVENYDGMGFQAAGTQEQDQRNLIFLGHHLTLKTNATSVTVGPGRPDLAPIIMPRL